MSITWSKCGDRSAKVVCSTGNETFAQAVTDGLDLDGVSSLFLEMEADVGATLSGAGTLACWFLDPAMRASGTAAFSTIVAGNVVTLNGVAFTARAAPSGAYEFALGASDTEAATNLAAAINRIPAEVKCSAVGSGATVIITALLQGYAGASIALARTGAPITVSGTTLSAPWARLIERDVAVGGITGVASKRRVALLNGSTGIGVPVYLGAGRIAFSPESVTLSGGGVTIYHNAHGRNGRVL